MVTFANLGSVRSEDTAHLVCQLSIFNSFPVIRTASAKNRRFHVPQPTFYRAVYAVMQCPSVCLSVRLSRSWITSK